MKNTPWLAFSIDRRSKIPVFEQICAGVRARVRSGAIGTGARMPATRVFAIDLGVSRSTIVTAYEQLVAEGYLSAVQGSGYCVCAAGEVELPAPRMSLPPETPAEIPATRPHPFAAGKPDMRLFPHQQWAKAVARVCRNDPQSLLTGGAQFGSFALRGAIAQHVLDWRGIDATAQQIIVTAGSTDALEICIRSLTKTGDTVALENPGYRPLRHFVEAQNRSAVFMQIDASGAIVPPLDASPRMAVLTPSHQYPLGGAMTASRRQEFLAWALRGNTWIIEDDYDSEFRYAGRPIPAMAGFDGLNRTIYIGSFSKIFSNALRIGYAIVPVPLLDDFRAAVTRFAPKASLMPQQPLADFMESGEFYRHLRRVRRIYAERRKFLLHRLARDFGHIGRFDDHQAGMQVVLHLGADVDDIELANRAAQRGIAVEALSEFCAGGLRQSGLILGFCASTESEMDPALNLLKQCFD